jgi:hypothetical protein
MKRFLTSLFVVVPFFLFSQQNTVFDTAAIDARLYAVFGKAYIEESIRTDQFALQWWTFYLDNAFVIVNEPPTKDGSVGDFPLVRIADFPHVNILQLEKEQNLTKERNVDTVYRIAGTSKYLIYHSGRNLVDAFNAYREALKNRKN